MTNRWNSHIHASLPSMPSALCRCDELLRMLLDGLTKHVQFLHAERTEAQHETECTASSATDHEHRRRFRKDVKSRHENESLPYGVPLLEVVMRLTSTCTHARTCEKVAADARRREEGASQRTSLSLLYSAANWRPFASSCVFNSSLCVAISSSLDLRRFSSFYKTRSTRRLYCASFKYMHDVHKLWYLKKPKMKLKDNEDFRFWNPHQPRYERREMLECTEREISCSWGWTLETLNSQ
jgi:hypothetical protein